MPRSVFSNTLMLQMCTCHINKYRNSTDTFQSKQFNSNIIAWYTKQSVFYYFLTDNSNQSINIHSMYCPILYSMYCPNVKLQKSKISVIYLENLCERIIHNLRAVYNRKLSIVKVKHLKPNQTSVLLCIHTCQCLSV